MISFENLSNLRFCIQNNTALVRNNQELGFLPKTPTQLVVSPNSAFKPLGKRRRSGFRDLVRNSLKRHKPSEEVNKICIDVTNSSSSSLKSSLSDAPVKQIHDENVGSEAKSETSDTSSNHSKKREEKMRTKEATFSPYSSLNMKLRHDFYEQPLKDMNQKQNVRGRKRTNIVKKAKNLQELMTQIVIPEWEVYLVEKRDKENSSRKKLIRSDAVWKKLMRDCREFYRILFKNRFHRMDYQDCDDKKLCIRTLTLELGFPEFCEDNLIYSYNFFHQIHLSEKNKEKYQNILSESSTGFDALNWYTNKTRTLFLEDPLCSRLLYFLYRNYADIYSDLLSKNIKDKVVECIDHVLEKYEGLGSDDEAISTADLPI